MMVNFGVHTCRPGERWSEIRRTVRIRDEVEREKIEEDNKEVEGRHKREIW